MSLERGWGRQEGQHHLCRSPVYPLWSWGLYVGHLKILPLRTDEASGLALGREVENDGRQRNSQLYPNFHVRSSFAVTAGPPGCAYAPDLAGDFR